VGDTVREMVRQDTVGDTVGEQVRRDNMSCLVIQLTSRAVLSLQGVFKLDGEVQEGGGNFSAGQRQLLCLARCLVTKPRILLVRDCPPKPLHQVLKQRHCVT
jgi:ABC-type multidrug transport system fused ATPase/permease subunit